MLLAPRCNAFLMSAVIPRFPSHTLFDVSSRFSQWRMGRHIRKRYDVPHAWDAPSRPPGPPSPSLRHAAPTSPSAWRNSPPASASHEDGHPAGYDAEYFSAWHDSIWVPAPLRVRASHVRQPAKRGPRRIVCRLLCSAWECNPGLERRHWTGTQAHCRYFFSGHVDGSPTWSAGHGLAAARAPLGDERDPSTGLGQHWECRFHPAQAPQREWDASANFGPHLGRRIAQFSG